jgi:hypothetical protein
MDSPSFLLSFEPSYQKESQMPVWAALLDGVVRLTKSLLQPLPSVCKMVVRGLDCPEAPPQWIDRDWPDPLPTLGLVL